MNMGMVHTSIGMIERERLTVTDVVTDEPNARITKTIWRLDGEMVREDLYVNILQGQAVFGEQGNL